MTTVEQTAIQSTKPFRLSLGNQGWHAVVWIVAAWAAPFVIAVVFLLIQEKFAPPEPVMEDVLNISDELVIANVYQYSGIFFLTHGFAGVAASRGFRREFSRKTLWLIPECLVAAYFAFYLFMFFMIHVYAR